MTHEDRTPFEDELAGGLRAMAVAPTAGLLEEVMRRIDTVRQRRSVRVPGRRPTWRWAVLAAAGVVAGVAVGLSAGVLLPDRAVPASPGLTSSAPVSADPSVTSSADASSPPAESPPAAAHDADASWERLDLPDPASGVFGGGLSSDIVAFDGGYLIVGSVEGYCASDISEPPPDCEATLAQLTSRSQLASGGAWISDDGRTWEFASSAAFAGGRIGHAATDGHRIIVTGETSEAPAPLRSGSWNAALWVSTDGRDWRLASQTEPLPNLVAWMGSAWVGARNTDSGPQFLVSGDGVAWEVTTAPGDLGQGRVNDLAVGADGSALAVGYLEVVDAAGLLQSGRGLAWWSEDGREWQSAPEQESLSVTRGGAYLMGATATDDGWVAVGRADDAAGRGGVWHSNDGLAWERVSSQDSPASQTLDGVAWTDPGFVAVGTIPGPRGSTMAAWVSADGDAWTEVARQPALEEGQPRAVLADGDRVIVVGARASGPDHWTPVVYLTSR